MLNSQTKTINKSHNALHSLAEFPLALVLRSVLDSQLAVFDRDNLLVKETNSFHMLLFLAGLSRMNLLTPSLQTIFYQWVRRDSIIVNGA